MTERSTSIVRDPRRIDRCIVTVIGSKGQGTFVRSGWQSAVETARRYAAMFDAPCAVI